MKSDKNSFIVRWDAAFSIKIKTVEQWNRYYREALRVEESWPAGKHFKLKKMPSIVLADLRTLVSMLLWSHDQLNCFNRYTFKLDTLLCVIGVILMAICCH